MGENTTRDLRSLFHINLQKTQRTPRLWLQNEQSGLRSRSEVVDFGR